MSNNLALNIKNHPLIRSLLRLKGNQRSCVYTEPLWGIPNSLYAPFISIYMYSLGVSNKQIGLIASMITFMQIFAALFSGVITDKLGRKRTTFFFDFIAWSIPCVLWSFSQNFWWFLLAASFNSLWQITGNSWTCLLVEDAEQDGLVHMYNWIYISGQLAVFFAPISGLLVKNLSVVPTMRILYFVAFISMTAKFIILYKYSDETTQGKIRMEETKNVSLLKTLSEYKDKLPLIFNLKSPDMLLSLAIMIIFNVSTMVTTNFFGLYVTRSLKIPVQYLAYFPILRSIIMLMFIFGIQHRFDKLALKFPMLLGAGIYIISHVLLIVSTEGSFFTIIFYVIAEAFAYALIMPRKESIIALSIQPEERARILSIMTASMLCFSVPFGYIAGWLMDINGKLPFIMNILFFLLALVIIMVFKKLATTRNVVSER